MHRFGVVPKARRTLDGIVFASRGEMNRYAELRLLEKAGRIVDLRLQVPFELRVNDHLVCTYVADFVYVERGGASTGGGISLVLREVVEDSKTGERTPLFRLKKRLMLACLGIDVRETGGKTLSPRRSYRAKQDHESRRAATRPPRNARG